MTCSGRIHPIAVNDNVYLVEDIQHKVIKILPEEGAVRLKKINSNDRPFKRSLRQIWMPPPLISDATVVADLPTTNCLCPDPEPPQILPDIADGIAQTDSQPLDTVEAMDAMDSWVSLITDFSSFQQMEDSMKELRQQLKETQARLENSQGERKAMEIQRMDNEKEIDDLRNQLKTLKDTHSELVNHSLAQLQTIHGLQDRLKLEQPNSENILQLLRRLLLTLPTDLDKDNTPDDTLYYFLCSSPTDDDATLKANANLLIKSLHPDKSSIPNDPLVQEARNLPAFIKLIKNAITTPAIRRVYDHCGLPGLQRLLNCRLRCHTCIPRRPDGAPTRQGELEYPQLHVLYHSS